MIHHGTNIKYVGEKPCAKGGLRRFGTIGLVLLFLFSKLKYLGIILQVGRFQIYKSFKTSKLERARYHGVPLGKRIGMGIAFLFLLAVTSIGMLVMQGPLQGI
jgi:hypothetical protein